MSKGSSLVQYSPRQDVLLTPWVDQPLAALVKVQPHVKLWEGLGRGAKADHSVGRTDLARQML